MGRRRAHPRRGPGDRDRRGAHGRVDGPRGAREDARDRDRPLLVEVAPRALAQGRDLRQHPARRRDLRRLRPRHAPGPGPPGRGRLPYGGAVVLLHASRRRASGAGAAGRRRRPRDAGGAGTGSFVAQGGAAGRIVYRGAFRARGSADLPQDRRRGDRGRDSGARRRRVADLWFHTMVLLASRGIPLRVVFEELSRRHVEKSKR